MHAGEGVPEACLPGRGGAVTNNTDLAVPSFAFICHLCHLPCSSSMWPHAMALVPLMCDEMTAAWPMCAAKRGGVGHAPPERQGGGIFVRPPPP